MIGKTILHYKILEKLGEGGMGVVYKAEDTKLNRTVALKFLPPEMLKDENAKQRFIQEAQAASALDHQNIITIYDINEDKEGQVFIAMAYYDGDALNNLLKNKPLKINQAIDIAIQIAQGLEAAHKNKIVHRDIKPGNIMVSEEGEVKILDFGLAKLSGQSLLTKKGSTLGTIAYMSPEQGRGEKVDHRSDIWSLGVVLYEMLTGQLPFKGDYEQAVVYSIQSEEPEPLTALRTGVPMELERIVNKMLCKDPKERYQHAADLIVDLRAVKKTSSDVSVASVQRTVVPPAANPTFNWVRLTLAGVLITLVLFLVIVKPWAEEKQSPQPVMRFAVDCNNDGALSTGGMPLAISPDGTKIVYVISNASNYRLVLSHLKNSIISKVIPGTEGAVNPSFSPDGNWIVFYANGTIKKVSVLGGQPQTLCKLVGAERTAHFWNDDNTIIFTQQLRNELFELKANGGLPQALIPKDSVDNKFPMTYHPQLLPDGKTVLLRLRAQRESADDLKLALLDLKTGKYKIIIENSGYGRYVPTGHIVYSQNGDLLAVPFDLKTKKLTGQAIPVLSGLWSKEAGNTSIFALSDNGTLVYFQEDGIESTGRLLKTDFNGHSEIIPTAGRARHPRISPDGHFCVYWAYELDYYLYIYDFQRKLTRKLTHKFAVWPLWNLSSKEIFFTTFSFTGIRNVANMVIDGSREPELLLDSKYTENPLCMTPDGKSLIFGRYTDHKQSDIYQLPLQENKTPVPLLTSFANEEAAVLSPDGKWLAYSSDESGRYEIYIKSFPELGGIRQISTDGGREPCWAPDGKHIYYRSNDGKKLYQVTFQSMPAFNIGTPQLILGNANWPPSWALREYDLSPDSKYFIIPEYTVEPWKEKMIVVVNWFEEMKAKMAAAEER